MNMKKWLALLLTVVLCLALLSGCGEKPVDDEPDDGQQQTDGTDSERNHTAPENTDGNLIFTFFGNLELPSASNPQWGDCTLVTLPDGGRVLVDACEGGYETYIVQQLKDEGVSSIDAAIISHYHTDHYGGLVTFIEEFDIRTVYIDAIELDESLEWNTNAQGLSGYIDRLEGMGVKVVPVLAGDQAVFGEVTVDFLFPAADTEAATTNDASLVFTFNWKGQRALFTSDLYYAGEDICLKEVDNSLLKCDLMKIMHHGGNTSGGSEFIEVASPKAAVAMGNHVMTDLGVYRYTKVGCEVYQTWQTGDVNVMMDGTELTVWTQQ